MQALDSVLKCALPTKEDKEEIIHTIGSQIVRLTNRLPVNKFKTMLSIWKVNCKNVSIFFLMVGDVLPDEV